jgi:flagellar hook-length control protein FliK
LVTALKDTISKSGFFYEAHQAQWVTGERSLESLLQEPQAKLSLPTVEQKSIAPVVTDKNSSDSPISSTQIKNAASETVLASNVTKLGSDVASQQTVAAGPREPVHPLSSSIVQQQLNILDTRQIAWQGQVWPGQNMEWEIEEDGQHRASGIEGDEAVWRTRLHLDFPALGGVTAHLSLGAGGVKVDFSVEQASSVGVLQTEVPSLAQSMESSGLKVAGLAVRQDGGS